MFRDGLSLHTSTHLPSGTTITPCTFSPLTPSPIVPCSLRRSEPLKNGVGEAGEVGNSFGGKKWEQQEREKEEDGDKCRAEKCEEDTYQQETECSVCKSVTGRDMLKDEDMPNPW